MLVGIALTASIHAGLLELHQQRVTLQSVSTRSCCPGSCVALVGDFAK